MPTHMTTSDQQLLEEAAVLIALLLARANAGHETPDDAHVHEVLDFDEELANRGALA